MFYNSEIARFYMWQMWLIVAGVCFVFEIFTVGFLIFWLAIGALIAMVASFFVDNVVIQTAIFVVSSAILIFATRPFVKKFAKNDKDDVKTNAYSIIGKTGVVMQNIDSLNSTGLIKVDGEVWSASTDKDVSIPKGSEVKVKEIKGVKAIVTPK